MQTTTEQHKINLVALAESGWKWVMRPAKDIQPGDIHHPCSWSTPCTVEGIGYFCGHTVLNLVTEAGTRFGVGFEPDEMTKVWTPGGNL